MAHWLCWRRSRGPCMLSDCNIINRKVTVTNYVYGHLLAPCDVAFRCYLSEPGAENNSVTQIERTGLAASMAAFGVRNAVRN